jgi:hypothetical protein
MNERRARRDAALMFSEHDRRAYEQNIWKAYIFQFSGFVSALCHDLGDLPTDERVLAHAGDRAEAPLG